MLEKSLIGTAALVLLFAPTLLAPVWAALGETAASVERDRVMMKGQRQSRGGAAGYSIDTITVAGIKVKEYVSSDGVVFAVVWTGTGVPDLQLLLGEYFEEYRQGVNAARSHRPKIRKPFQLKSERLVVERGGHSRSLWGRAFLPAALPPGVTAEDIQ
jgi:Protein of unknown function (DUF2844)